MKRRSPRASASSAACFMRYLGPRTKRKGWAPSSRSGRRPSKAGEQAKRLKSGQFRGQVERAALADRLEVAIEPMLCRLAAELAQRLQERPRRVDLGGGAERFELAVAADAMKVDALVAGRIQRALIEQAGERIYPPPIPSHLPVS